jgi:hypothetical protein
MGTMPIRSCFKSYRVAGAGLRLGEGSLVSIRERALAPAGATKGSLPDAAAELPPALRDGRLRATHDHGFRCAPPVATALRPYQG